MSKALQVRLQMGDPLQIARSRSHLAEIALGAHKYKEAATNAEQAYQSLTVLEDPEKTDLVSALIVLAYARCGEHDCAQGVDDARQAVAISRAAFQPNSMPVGAALTALGSVELKNGATAEAEETIRQAIPIMKAKFAPLDPRLVYAMVRFRDCLLAQHKNTEAQQVRDQLASIGRQANETCAGCSVSVYGLSNSIR